MMWMTRFLFAVTQHKLLIELIYAASMIWLFARFILVKRFTLFSLRDRLGASGLLTGICSWALFAFFYVYLAAQHRIIFSGSVYSQVIYDIVGSCTAIAGAVLALIGRGWVRRSALFVSLGMCFHWLGLWFLLDVGLDQWITIGTLALVVAWGTISLATWYVTKESRTTSIRQQE